MLKFTDRKDVVKYEITRNYRSTSTIVEHARALIERNAPRIRKDLRAYNPMQQHIKTVQTTPETVAAALLQALESSQETAVLARTNYETDQIQTMLTNHPTAPEITTIHKAKGREWEKVILIHNTLERQFPRRDSELTEERRVFYVAMTRAKSRVGRSRREMSIRTRVRENPQKPQLLSPSVRLLARQKKNEKRGRHGIRIML